MKKTILILLTIALFTAPLTGQERVSPEPDYIGINVAMQQLQSRKITIAEDTNLEITGAADISIDTIPLPENEGIPERLEILNFDVMKMEYINNKRVVKVNLTPKEDPVWGFRAKIMFPRPLFIEGITKTISAWLKPSPNTKMIKLICRDIYDIEYKIPIYRGYENGEENYWREYTTALAPHFPQRTFGSEKSGFTVLGMEYIFYDGKEAELYFDVLTCVTDLFMYTRMSGDLDEMKNNW